MNTTATPEPGGHADDPVPETSEPVPPVLPQRTSRPSPGRFAWLVSGLALLLTGLAMLSYVAWEYWGTDVVSRHEQADLRTELRAQWHYPTVADLLGPDSSDPALGSAVALVRIPRFGRSFEVPVIEGVRGNDLARGIGHFPGTAGPGQIGNFALAAHRVTNGEPFRDLPELRPGDKVIVETADATYIYIVDTNPNALVVPFTQTWVISPVPVAPQNDAPPGMPTFATAAYPTHALITLTTCSEIFHTDTRMVAFGHLVRTIPK